jgi:hypothetical protein
MARPRQHPRVILALPRRLPDPIRFMLKHGALGMVIGGGSAAALIAADWDGIGGLLNRSPSGFILSAALILLFAGTGGGAQIAFAIGLLADPKRPGRDGNGGGLAAVPVPLRVPAPPRGRPGGRA